MTEYDHDQNLDKLLDSVLADYSSVEPRPGLETRILATVREVAETAPSPWRNWRWLWAGAVAVLAIAFIALFAGKHPVVPAPRNDVVQKQQPAAQPGPEIVKAAPLDSGNDPAHPRPKRLQPHPEADALKIGPRRPVFPTPAPLSEQEKLLLSYYAQTPREELIAQSRPEEPPAAVDDQSNIPVPELILVPQKSSNTR
jgi:hypothetical protein